MLVLTRKKGESIMIGESIEVVILQTEGETVKIGINAPKDIEIYRKEIYNLIQESNRESSVNMPSLQDLGAFFRKKGE